MAITINSKSFSDLKWMGTSQVHQVSGCDVTITKYSDGRLSITFRNNCWKKLSSGGAHSRIEFAVFDDNTIVFRTNKSGYKLSPSGISTSHISFSTKNMDKDLREQLYSFIGDYELRYEETFKLWYISKG